MSEFHYLQSKIDSIILTLLFLWLIEKTGRELELTHSSILVLILSYVYSTVKWNMKMKQSISEELWPQKKCYTLSSGIEQQVSYFWKTHFLSWNSLCMLGLTEGNTLARHCLHKWITLKNYLRWTVFYLQSVKVNSQTILKQFQNQWVIHFFNTFLNKLFTC